MKTFKQFLEESSYIAKEGESPIVHHATTRVFNNIRPLSHFGTHKAAREIATAKSERNTHEKDLPHLPVSIHTARIRLGNVVEINDIGEHHPLNLMDEVSRQGHIPRQVYKDTEEHFRKKLKPKAFQYLSYNNNRPETRDEHPNDTPLNRIRPKARSYMENHVSKVLRKHGIDTIKYKNNHEDAGSTSYIITHHSQLRYLKKKDRAKINYVRAREQEFA